MSQEELTREKLREYMEKCSIPEHSRESIEEYVLYGRGLGDFLRSVFSNELHQSFSRADVFNKPKIENYVMFMYNYVPADCWGGKQEYKKWCEKGGFVGKIEK